MPTAVLEPVDVNEAASMLVDAVRQRMALVPRGSGTKLALTTDSSRYCLSTKRLDSPVQHFAGDLVATLPAGITLASANETLAQAGQWLPLDPPFADRATIGGIVAANDSGPRRHKYGAPRDLIIGVELALCDGRIARAGGRVVKNVAGYDLSRLVCGSFGSLALITSATFKLAPLAAVSRTVVARCGDAAHAARLALTAASLPVTPSALEIQAPAGRLLIRFETTEQAAEQMAEAVRGVLVGAGASAEMISGNAERELWQNHDASIWDATGIVAKVSVLPTDVEPVMVFLESLTAPVKWSAIGRAALGVLLVRLDATGDDETVAITKLCQEITTRKGTVAIERGSAAIRSIALTQVDPALTAVMQAVKSQFDPTGILPALPGVARTLQH